MASLDTSYVRRELQAIIAASQAVSKQVRKILAGLKENPGQYDLLEDVPRWIRKKFPHAIFRKIKIEHNPHNFRLIVVHWRFGGGRSDHVDMVYAFRRLPGYEIDWDWVATLADDGDDE